MVEVKGDEKIECDIVINSKKRILDAHDDERTRSSDPKSRNHDERKKKHISMKGKKVSKGPIPKKRRIDEKKELYA